MKQSKLWQLYHLNSRVNSSSIGTKLKQRTNFQKSYIFKNFKSWSLKNQLPDAISFLSELLISSYALKSATPYRRNVVSAGALYPIDIYFSLNIKNEIIPDGIYYYSIDESEIYLIKNFNHINIPQLFLQEEFEAAKVMIYFVANFIEVDNRYDERGYRYILLEAGHIAQNFNLQAERLGLEYKNIGGYFEETINSSLDLNGFDSSCIYCFSIM